MRLRTWLQTPARVRRIDCSIQGSSELKKGSALPGACGYQFRKPLFVTELSAVAPDIRDTGITKVSLTVVFASGDTALGSVSALPRARATRLRLV